MERLFKTVQDRLVKELRLQGISTMAQANSFLESYRVTFNEQFAKAPCDAGDAGDAHRECLEDKRQMKLILSKQSQRVLSKHLLFHYQNNQYMVQMKSPGSLRGARVTVCEHRDGEIVLLYKGRELAYKEYRLGKAPVAPDHPWRRWRGILKALSAAGNRTFVLGFDTDEDVLEGRFKAILLLLFVFMF